MENALVLTPSEAIAKYCLTIESTFIPHSISRHKDSKTPTLNWRVKILSKGIDLWTIDYSAGSGHIPFYRASASKAYNAGYIAWVCEEGRAANNAEEVDRIGKRNGISKKNSSPVLPVVESVICSVLQDADAISFKSFEDWAANMGFDTDSREGEKAYRTCLETGLNLHAQLGDTALRELKEAFQDY